MRCGIVTLVPEAVLVMTTGAQIHLPVFGALLALVAHPDDGFPVTSITPIAMMNHIGGGLVVGVDGGESSTSKSSLSFLLQFSALLEQSKELLVFGGGGDFIREGNAIQWIHSLRVDCGLRWWLLLHQILVGHGDLGRRRFGAVESTTHLDTLVVDLAFLIDGVVGDGFIIRGKAAIGRV